jgi:hypothetical protein
MRRLMEMLAARGGVVALETGAKVRGDGHGYTFIHSGISIQCVTGLETSQFPLPGKNCIHRPDLDRKPETGTPHPSKRRNTSA